MNKIHEYLVKNSGPYAYWHKKPICQLSHWAIFIIIAVTVAGNLSTQINSSFVDSTISNSITRTPPYEVNKRGLIGRATDHILVEFKFPVSSNHAQKVLTKHKFKERSAIRNSRIKLISIPAGETPEEALAKLKLQDGNLIEEADVDGIVSMAAIPNDPMISSENDKFQMNAPQAWDSVTGRGDIRSEERRVGKECRSRWS